MQEWNIKVTEILVLQFCKGAFISYKLYSDTCRNQNIIFLARPSSTWRLYNEFSRETKHTWQFLKVINNLLLNFRIRRIAQKQFWTDHSNQNQSNFDRCIFQTQQSRLLMVHQLLANAFLSLYAHTLLTADSLVSLCNSPISNSA